VVDIDEEALDFGTSFGSLGVEKLSAIKTLDDKAVAEIRREIAPYQTMIARHFKDDRLRYLNVVL